MKTKTKPTWDIYFLKMADLISTRSLDPSTKHGCVLVDKNHRVVSTGYNSPIQGILDSEVPLNRPDKYAWFLHSEENAMLFARQDLTGGTAYITGMPCSRCLRGMIQAGIKKIVHGGRGSVCVDETDLKHSLKMAKMKEVEIVESKVVRAKKQNVKGRNGRSK